MIEYYPQGGFRMSSFIDKIKEQNFEEIKKSEITADDIREFAIYYQEILDLKDNYASVAIGRKEIANEIREKLSPLNTFLYYLTNRNKSLVAEFEYAEQSISDYEIAMRLLLRLANENGDDFTLKRFITTSFASFETQHGDREHEQVGGNVWVIGEKIVLDKVGEKEHYFGGDFGKVANDILQKGHSLVIMTDHYYENNVKPCTYDSNEIQRTNISVYGMSSDISCYLYDDNLRNAVNKFMAFINQNGADIKGIDENQLFDIMKTGNVSCDKNLSKKLNFVKKDN